MPRSRKRKTEGNSDAAQKERVEDKKEEFSDKESPTKKKKESSESLTFKIEHWYVLRNNVNNINVFNKLMSWLNFRIPGYLFAKGGKFNMQTSDQLRTIVFRVRKQWDYCCHVLICMVKTIVRIRVLHGPITRAVNPPCHQMLRMNYRWRREGIIDDIMSPNKWRHFVPKKRSLISIDVYST